MKEIDDNKSIREPRFAGQFYTADKSELIQQLEEYYRELDRQEKPAGDELLRAIISPHAGYLFSGKVAAAAFQRIPPAAHYNRIFILASSHRYSFDGAAPFCEGNYSTPIGEVDVDTRLCKKLVNDSPVFFNYPGAHDSEHSIEVQLPFLQRRLENPAPVVPVIIGTHSAATCRKIADGLRPYFTSENLFIISTDFSHYPGYDDAVKVDNLTAGAICSNHPENLIAVLEENKKLKVNNLATSLCGWTSVLTLLYLTENTELQINKLKYLNSGDAKIYSDRKRVVGYWAMQVIEKKPIFHISEEEKKEILEKARKAIETYVKTGKRGEISPALSGGILNEKTGVFVSVYIKGKLRGCIGGFAQDKTLNEMVQGMAASASCDRRFEAVQPDELDDMELEISVLSPLKKINSVNEIELGKHGIYIKKDFRSGTFLPQVATKTGWSLEEFLGHCARDKAGIGWEGWKTADLYTYEAVIFRGTGK